MSEDKQQELVSVLYTVHDRLRAKRGQAKNEGEWENVWKAHTSDWETLQTYSKAMHELATKVWEPRNTKPIDGQQANVAAKDEKSVKIKCRLDWVFQCCMDYFKEERVEKLRLLDVGSCYNPFSKFSSNFDIVAIDLCPAPGFEDQIFQCDFLEVKLVDIKDEECKMPSFKSFQAKFVQAVSESPYDSLSSIPHNYFDVVVFSYFLEYLADAKQRETSCRKAHELLKPGGLLFVLRPDSSRVTPKGNNILIKKMKIGMALLGFKRIYFEKLEHLWCMAFKKLGEEDRNILVQGSYFKKDVSKVGVGFAVDDFTRVHELFCISQDFKHHETDLLLTHESSGIDNDATTSLQCNQTLFDALPNLEVSLSD